MSQIITYVFRFRNNVQIPNGPTGSETIAFALFSSLVAQYGIGGSKRASPESAIVFSGKQLLPQ